MNKMPVFSLVYINTCFYILVFRPYVFTPFSPVGLFTVMADAASRTYDSASVVYIYGYGLDVVDVSFAVLDFSAFRFYPSAFYSFSVLR